MEGQRVLIYSHDTFGLGHLRRCRAIAHALVDRNPHLSVLILSGSPIIGSFDFQPHVDFVRIPGVIKLSDGDYTSLSLDLDIRQTLQIRESIIRHTAEVFDPHLFIVDKEPLGLRGEVLLTLEDLKRRGTPLVLGLRDVLDDPASLAGEWARKNVEPALVDLYDEIWVYGLPQICDPLEGLGLPASVAHKVIYTGYLPRAVPETASDVDIPDEPYLLVTPGGGGDGAALVDAVLGAYESPQAPPWPALILTGPFMGSDIQAPLQARADNLDRVELVTFSSRPESLMAGAAGVVAMGGYNTFCEILSFDRPALLVPRTRPRREQAIRAGRAAELGLVAHLDAERAGQPAVMAAALRQLPQQPRPSQRVIPGLLDGLDNVNRLVQARAGPARPRWALVESRV